MNLMKKRILHTLLTAMFSLFALSAWSQITVTGVVKSDQGEAMPGVSIQVKGTTRGTLTDGSGKYIISVPDAKAILVFSFLGMQPEELNAERKVYG